MSLTTFLEQPDVVQRFKAAFPRPPIPVSTLMAAPPLTNHYALTGTAFDYLFRFMVTKFNHHVIPAAIPNWVATNGAVRLELIAPSEFKRAQKRIQAAVQEWCVFSSSRARMPHKDLISASIDLAQLDFVYRSGTVDFALPPADRRRICADLAALVRAVPLERFRAKSCCIPNPSFSAAKPIRGADADLILDDTLLEIKATKNPVFDRKVFNQLLGYFCLAQIGGVNGRKSPGPRIARLGVYHARQSDLIILPVATLLGTENLPEFLRWFKARISHGVVLGELAPA